MVLLFPNTPLAREEIAEPMFLELQTANPETEEVVEEVPVMAHPSLVDVGVLAAVLEVIPLEFMPSPQVL